MSTAIVKVEKLEKAAVLPAKSVEQFVETKLTKSELVDLVMDDILKDLQARVDEAQAALDAVKPVEITAAMRADVMATEPQVATNSWYRQTEIEVTYRKTFSGVGKKANPDVKRWLRETSVAQKNLDAASSDLRQVRDRRASAKTEIIRRVLNSTEAGREFMGSLAAFKASMRASFKTGKTGR